MYKLLYLLLHFIYLFYHRELQFSPFFFSSSSSSSFPFFFFGGGGGGGRGVIVTSSFFRYPMAQRSPNSPIRFCTDEPPPPSLTPPPPHRPPPLHPAPTNYTGEGGGGPTMSTSSPAATVRLQTSEEAFTCSYAGATRTL